MIVGKIYQMGVEEMPEKGGMKESVYPFASLEKGEAVLITPEEKDDVTLVKLRKKIVGASQQYLKRVGKAPNGEKMKEFVVWVAEEEEGVMIGCRKDNSKEPASTASKKKAAKKVEGDDLANLSNP